MTDADRILRLRRLATQPLDTPDGDAILVADVLDILDDKGGPDELDRLRVTVQRVRQACHEDPAPRSLLAAAILAILGADHG